MSRHYQKYPGLYAGVKTHGVVSYQTAYIRVSKFGWSIERAISTPAGKPGRPRGVKQGPRPRTPVPTSLREIEAVYEAHWKKSLVPPWERQGYVPSPVFKKRPVIHRRGAAPANDTSPAHIRKLRAAFCDHFIKTGDIDQAMQAQLTRYANECRAASKHLERVPDEPTSRDPSGASRAGDDSRGAHVPVDELTADRIADFLRMGQLDPARADR